MQNRFFCLSGLPRSGSTLLGSILNQNPYVYTSPTSPLYPLLVATNERLNLLSLQHTFDNETVGHRLYHSLFDAFYPASRQQPVVFDKHRGWPKNINAIARYAEPSPRIIAMVRPIAEILTSYITLANDDPDNFIDRHLRREQIPVSDESRAHLLWTHYLNDATGEQTGPYECLQIGLQTYPEHILLVDYDRLCYQPAAVLREVYAFCDMEPFEHDFSNIENTCAEAKDQEWGLKNLHRLRRRLGKTSPDPLTVLPQAAIDYFSQFDLTGVATW